MHLNRSGKIFLFIYCRMQEAVHSKKLMQSGSFPIWMLLSPNTLCWAPLLPTPALICSNKGIKMACILRVDTSVESQIAKKAWLIRVSWFCYSCAPFLCHQLSVADVMQIGSVLFTYWSYSWSLLLLLSLLPKLMNISDMYWSYIWSLLLPGLLFTQAYV